TSCRPRQNFEPVGRWIQFRLQYPGHCLPVRWKTAKQPVQAPQPAIVELISWGRSRVMGVKHNTPGVRMAATGFVTRGCGVYSMSFSARNARFQTAFVLHLPGYVSEQHSSFN